MLSNTLAPPKLGNSTRNRHQSSLASSEKQIKTKTPREVVLHHPMASPPPEDWILYPDEVIITKHSSVRRRRSCKTKDPQSEDSHQPWIRRDPIQAKSGHDSQVGKDVQRRKEIPSAPSKSPDSVAPAWEGNRYLAGRQPRPKFPERLPTPDISDIEEADFWSCCGSSESSTLRELDSA